MPGDTYDVSMPVDRKVIDRHQRLQMLGLDGLEELFTDISKVLEYYQGQGHAARDDVRGGVDFEHPTGDDVTDLMDTNLLEVLRDLDYLSNRERGYQYVPQG